MNQDELLTIALTPGQAEALLEAAETLYETDLGKHNPGDNPEADAQAADLNQATLALERALHPVWLERMNQEADA